jgi:outer membrane protein TolC
MSRSPLSICFLEATTSSRFHRRLSLNALAVVLVALCMIFGSCGNPVWAQLRVEGSRSSGTGFVPSPVRPLYTLTEAVDTAGRNFPSLRMARSRIRQTEKGITLARTAYLPSLDLLVQELRGTKNNITGLIFPQTADVIPVQTGIATNSSNFKSIWANNQGANLSWLAYDFGLRKANVILAQSERNQARAALELTDLDVSAAAAENYLLTVGNNEVIRAQQVTVKRMEAWQLVVHTLVDQGLRPGVDSARADADLSFAKIALIEAERDTELARADLAETLGLAGGFINFDRRPWVRKPASQYVATNTVNPDQHPLAVFRSRQVRTEASKVHVLDRTWFPHLWLHSAIWSRGSGDRQDPRVRADGIIPQTANWVVGVSINFPVLDYFEVKARKGMATAAEQTERANYDLAIQMLLQKDARARVLLDSARRIADETPKLVEAARENETKALARYKVGLTDIVEVAEAERILARAEVEDALAEVRVWRAILAVAYAQGDLRPFLILAKAAEGNT